MTEYPPNEYPPNSYTSAASAGREEPPPKNVQRVTVTPAARKKLPLGKRVKDLFLGGGTEGILSYVLHDVMVPAARDMAADAVTTLIERMLFGDGARPSSRRSTSRSGSYTNYRQYSTPPPPANRWARDRDDPRPRLSRQARVNHDFQEIVVGTDQEARDVLTQLNDLLATYGTASVHDFYELTGIDSDYTDHEWGWKDIRGSAVRAVRGGFEIYLPSPIPINSGRSRR